MYWINRSSLLLKALYNILRSRFINHNPFLLSHLITFRCNCQCPTCLWRGYTKDELTTEEILSIYKSARQNGFVALTLWGGEPLIRSDITQIIQSASDMGFVTLLITNGFRLPELASYIAPNLKALIVSIDFPSEKHDEFRGYPGLFKKAIDGIQLAKLANPNLKLSINCVIMSLNKNEIRDMIMLAKELDVSITFESMNVQMPFSELNASKFKLSPDEESEIFSQIRKYKLQGYKINNSFAYLDTFIGGKSKYICHSLEASLSLQANGDVRICLTNKPLANLARTDISKVLKMKEYRVYQKLGHQCCICNDFGTVECANIWNMNPKSLLGSFSVFLKR